MTTPKLVLPELSVSQASKEITHNQALAILDQLTQARVLDKDLATPPGSPANGDAYIVAASPTGAWEGKTGQIAYWLTAVNAWSFAVPLNGWLVYVNDENKHYRRESGAWVELGSLTVEDEGSTVVSGATRLNFVGSSVTVTDAGGGEATVTITGGGATLPVIQALSSTRNLALADINTFNVNSTVNNYTVTIPPQASVAWTADAEIHFLPSNTGDITITGGAGVSVNGVVAGSVTLSTQYGAASIKRVASDSWWVGGALASAEVSITGATALTDSAFGSMQVCTGTTVDYTVTLPAASGNAGKSIQIRMSSALTKLVTIDGNGSETIDGFASRVMRASESAVFLCDGTGWAITSYRGNPFRASAVKTANQSVAATAFTKVTFDAEEYDFGGAFDLANSRFVCARAGTYAIAGSVAMSLTASGDSGSFRVYKNGAQVRYAAFAGVSAATTAGMSGATYLQLAVGDIIESYVYNGSPGARDVVGNATAGTTVLSITEVIAP